MLQEAVNSSLSVTDVMRKLGIRWAGGSHCNIRNRIKREGISTEHFLGQGSNKGATFPHLRRRNEDILIDRSVSGYRREHAALLRRALVESGKELKCSSCQLGTTWNGAELVLEVDHINSNWLDDRADNLQFLCPNCHAVKTKIASFKRRTRRTQTNRIAVVRVRKSGIPKVLKMCTKCGNRIWNKSITCKKCRPQPCKIVWPDIEILIAAKHERRVWNLAKELGVSDSAIHKRIKRHLKGRNLNE